MMTSDLPQLPDHFTRIQDDKMFIKFDNKLGSNREIFTRFIPFDQSECRSRFQVLQVVLRSKSAQKR